MPNNVLKLWQEATLAKHLSREFIAINTKIVHYSENHCEAASA